MRVRAPTCRAHRGDLTSRIRGRSRLPVRRFPSKLCATLAVPRRLRMDGKLRKISPLALSIAMLTATAALAGDENFDTVAPGTLPADWICGVTGKGSPVWKVEADASAPSKPNVLRQSGSWHLSLVREAIRADHGRLCRSQSSSRSPAGRIRPAASYGGSRTPTTITLLAPTRSKTMYRSITRRKAGASPSNTSTAPVAAKQWHTLRVEFSGKAIKVMLDGKQYIRARERSDCGRRRRRRLDQGGQRHCVR